MRHNTLKGRKPGSLHVEIDIRFDESGKRGAKLRYNGIRVVGDLFPREFRFLAQLHDGMKALDLKNSGDAIPAGFRSTEEIETAWPEKVEG